jgi:hypothetical protein
MIERLTDAELDSVSLALAASSIAFVASDVIHRAISELRELRAEHSECQAIIDSTEAHATAWKAEYNKSFDENAKMRAALENIALGDHLSDWARHVAEEALASVKGDCPCICHNPGMPIAHSLCAHCSEGYAAYEQAASVKGEQDD